MGGRPHLGRFEGILAAFDVFALDDAGNLGVVAEKLAFVRVPVDDAPNVVWASASGDTPTSAPFSVKPRMWRTCALV
jgi:hypothetical protein